AYEKDLLIAEDEFLTHICNLFQFAEEKENHTQRKRQIPRPQNSFVLYRRNLSAAINTSAAINRNNIGFISREASKNWAKERIEVKQVYEVLSTYAKKVHNMAYPNYSYKPNVKNKTLTLRVLKSSDSQIMGLSKDMPRAYHSKNFVFLPPPIINVDNNNLMGYDKKVWRLVNDLNRV
ncbi:32545_t:CDS:2, partial [Gigaspora margarita]